MNFLTSQTHLHITTWVVAIVIFLIAALMGKQSKGLHMTLRLFYILIIITGGALFFKYQANDPMQYGLKFLGGILVIGMMEMVLVRQKKNKPNGLFWILFAVFLFITLYLGFKLPIGQNFLA
ncbi:MULTISPECIES: YisL family protein [unclassified Lysinibacillus]|uniref:YisL family protein n=1 Tax=unclassified Lysinibacillus TaxID=2636778 RepID=UPI00104D3DC1|nr:MULTISPECIES: YisL family protein [unclassified Lysinibacillus]MDD1504856.1 YisL family protein [Lysinibacillus sp. CNPSo 3705]UPW83814.1 YisL family protein [Lysinibacillus sp. Ag94]